MDDREINYEECNNRVARIWRFVYGFLKSRVGQTLFDIIMQNDASEIIREIERTVKRQADAGVCDSDAVIAHCIVSGVVSGVTSNITTKDYSNISVGITPIRRVLDAFSRELVSTYKEDDYVIYGSMKAINKLGNSVLWINTADPNEHRGVVMVNGKLTELYIRDPEKLMFTERLENIIGLTDETGRIAIDLNAVLYCVSFKL